MKRKIIRVTVKDAPLRIPVAELHGIQKNLKEMDKERFKKLRRLIVKRGFSFVLHVWKELVPVNRKRIEGDGAVVEDKEPTTTHRWRIIDGHGRVLVVKELLAEGYELEDGLPCVEIEAVSLADARKQVLAASSSYHRMTRDGLYEFMSEDGLEMEDIEDFDFAEIDQDKFEAEFFDGEDDDVDDDENTAEKPGERASNYQEQYGVIVICSDAKQQEEVFTRLMGEGFNCRVVVT